MSKLEQFMDEIRDDSPNPLDALLRADTEQNDDLEPEILDQRNVQLSGLSIDAEDVTWASPRLPSLPEDATVDTNVLLFRHSSGPNGLSEVTKCAENALRRFRKDLSPEEAKERDTVFDKIISREAPADIVYEDEKCIAFLDHDPKAPVHVLVAPKRRIFSMQYLEDKDEQLMGHLMMVCTKVAKILKLDDGYRVAINTGKHGCQTVYHLHVHLLGGRELKWGEEYI